MIEVNGIKLVNGDFPSLPDEGIIAFKLDGNRPPRQVTFKILKFTDLSSSARTTARTGRRCEMRTS